MDIKWKCDGCGQPAVTDSQYAGAEVECPNCKKSLTVPNIEPLQKQKSEEPKLKPGTKCQIHDHKVAFFTCAMCGQPACEMCLAAVDNYTYCQRCFTERKAMKKEKAPEPPAPVVNPGTLQSKTHLHQRTTTQPRVMYQTRISP